MSANGAEKKKGRLPTRLAGAAGALSLAGAVVLVAVRQTVSPVDVVLLIAFAVVSGTYAILGSADRERAGESSAPEAPDA